MPLGLVLGKLESGLVLLVPVRRHARELFADGVGAALDTIADAGFPGQLRHRTYNITKALEELFLFVGPGFRKAGFITLLAGVAVKSELKTGLGAVVGEVAGKAYKVRHTIFLLIFYRIYGRDPKPAVAPRRSPYWGRLR